MYSPIGALGQPRRECVAVGGVVDEPAGVEFVEQVHSGSPCCQVYASITVPIASSSWRITQNCPDDSSAFDRAPASRRVAVVRRCSPGWSPTIPAAPVGLLEAVSPRPATQPGPAVRRGPRSGACAAAAPELAAFYPILRRDWRPATWLPTCFVRSCRPRQPRRVRRGVQRNCRRTRSGAARCSSRCSPRSLRSAAHWLSSRSERAPGSICSFRIPRTTTNLARPSGTLSSVRLTCGTRGGPTDTHRDPGDGNLGRARPLPHRRARR